MRTTTICASWILFCCNVALLGLACSAEAAPNSLYLKADAGGNFISEITGEAVTPLGVSPAKAHPDPGFRVGVAAGYDFGAPAGSRTATAFAVEFEAAYLRNELGDTSGTLHQVPFLAKGLIRSEQFAPWVFEFGGGVGGAYVNIEDGDSDSDVALAWGAEITVHYLFSEKVSAGFGYKYLGVDSTSYSAGGGTLTIDKMHNHAVMVSLTWRF